VKVEENLLLLKMNLLHLPYELLIIIFEYVSGEDKVNLSATCRKLNEILKDKKLIR
jgi:hypothetical protein